MCIQGMMGRMEEKIAVDGKTIESALAHCGATLENQNTALISEDTRRMIFGSNGFQEYIWYRGKNAFCTGCGSELQGGTYSHNQAAVCPVCARAVTAKNARLGHKKLEQEFYAVEWRKSAIEKNSIVMIGIYCGVNYRNSERSDKTVVPILIDVFRYGKSAQRFQRSVWNYGRPAGCADWYRRRDVRSIGSSYFGHAVDVLQSDANFSRAISGTPFEGAYKTMLEVERPRFRHTGERSELISAIARRPWMEYMAKAGFKKIALTAEYSLPRGMFREKGRNLREIMKLSKDRYAEIKGKHLDIDLGLLGILQRGDAAGAKLKLCEAERLNHTLSSTWMPAELLKGRKLDRKLATYLLRLNADDVRELRDYWDMAVRNRIDLTIPENYLPVNLHQAHDRLLQIENDRRLAEQNAWIRERNEKNKVTALSNQEKLDKRLEKLERKYAFAFGGLILRPARSGIELIEEGNALNHCVGGYIERYASGHTDICFLRKENDPDKPWRTVEIDPKTERIIQDRGFHNDRNSNGQSTMSKELRAELDAFWAAFHKRNTLPAAV